MTSVRRGSKAVKNARAYDATGRQERARDNRDRVVVSAERLFLRDGFAATTIAAIAAEAAVSPDTIYKSFGGKAGLVRAIRARALLGNDDVPAEQRSDGIHAATTDPRVIITAWGRLTAEVAPLVAPIHLLVAAAATTDPTARDLLEEMNEERLTRMSENARRLHTAGHLRPGISLASATDVLWTYSAPELYELLVLRRGWTARRFGRFVADAMISALL